MFEENKNIEKTTELDTLEEMIEQEAENNVEEQLQNEKAKKKKLKKNRLQKIKNWWKALPKKKKILLIVGGILLLIVACVLLFFAIKNLQKEEVIEETPEVIVEQENYRYENGKLVFLNKENEEIGTYECENKDENLCFVAYYSIEDKFDVLRKVDENEKLILERTPIINDAFAFIKDNKTEEDETIKLYNLKENKTIEENYRLVKKADNESTSFILKNNESRYGIVTFTDTEMETKIPFSYDYLGFINTVDNYYVTKQTNRNIIINAAGKNMSKGIPGNIVGLTTKYVKTTDDLGKYTIYDYNGKALFSNYDYVELYNDYAALIKENKLALKFYDGAKLHEEEINLYNKDYVKMNVYDENKKVKETKESFSIEENENIINISVIKEKDINVTKINKLEGKRNKTIKLLNYFDGKLYFYKDTEKKDLLGVYTCNNKNNISNETQELANCFLAKDTIFENNELAPATTSGIIPVFNERFIFIKDNPDLVNESSQTIILYDLEKKSVISKYNAVNTYQSSGQEEITFKNVTDLQVAAKNKSNQYGVIKIGTTGVSSHIPFKYNALEKIGDYYSVNNGSGYLLLAKDTGNALFTNPVSGKIQNYNDDYVTGIENNQYYIYDQNGKKVTETGYTYIALYPTFFATVDGNNQLSLHTYLNPDNTFSENPISLNLNNYYGSGTLAFKINVSGLSYTIEIGTSANTYETKATGTIPRGDEE